MERNPTHLAHQLQIVIRVQPRPVADRREIDLELLVLAYQDRLRVVLGHCALPLAAQRPGILDKYPVSPSVDR